MTPGLPATLGAIFVLESVSFTFLEILRGVERGAAPVLLFPDMAKAHSWALQPVSQTLTYSLVAIRPALFYALYLM